MIKATWHRLHDRSGATYFRLFEDGKSGGDWIAAVDHTGAQWCYSFNVRLALPDDAPPLGWGLVGSPVRARRLANETLRKRCHAVWGDEISIAVEVK